MTARDHWPLHAAQWTQIGPPLRPDPEDLAICEAEVARWTSTHGRAPRVLLLGSTPELASIAGSSLVAVDRSRAMLGAVFPAEAGPAVVGDWRAMPFRDAAFDWIAGDGCATTLHYPDGYATFAAEVRRVLATGGELALRLFTLPESPEPLLEVARDLAANRIGNFHILKWRLAMAIQPPSRNVRVTEILDVFERFTRDRAALAERTGWLPATIDTIDAYRDSTMEYSFPTLVEVRAAFADHFDEVACLFPSYELGDRCPTLLLRAGTTRP